MSSAKFLSYYKFTPAKWLAGEINLCSYEAKGMFVDLCALFWAKEGVLKQSFVEQRFSKCSASVKQELFDLEILSYQDGLLQINFLVEQLGEFEGISEKRAEAGRKSAEARKQNLTSVEQNLTSVAICSTIKRREDKSKEDKIKEKEIKENKIKEENILCSEIISDLNEICKTNYKAETPKTKSLINTLLKQGFNLEDFKKVHRNMYDAWYLDLKMREFLRPITLYSNKFESYLNKLPKTELDNLGETGKKNITTASSWLHNQGVKNVK